jgi:hypothetical protein
MIDAILNEIKEALAEIFAPFFWELKGVPAWLVLLVAFDLALIITALVAVWR